MSAWGSTMNGTALTITSDVRAEQATVHLTGEVDVTNADHLRAVLLEHIRCGRTAVAIDISALTFIDCSGLTVLLLALTHAREHGARVQTEGTVHPRVRRIMDLTGAGAWA
jgi:anti-sigma B factor antagonist